MTTGANISEDYSISDARSGSIRVSRLVLTGWGDAPSASAGLLSFSDGGRLWAKYTSSSALLELFSRSTMLSGDRVAYTNSAVASGKADLVEDNSSGISGSCDVDNGTPGTNPTENATFDIVVSYADENDIADVLDGYASYLPTSGNRFERALNLAKNELDQWIVRSFQKRLRLDTWGRWLLAHIVNTRDLKRAQALLVAHMETLKRKGNIDTEERAEYYLAKAREAFANFTPVIDYERDIAPDNRETPGVIRLGRA